MVPIEIEMKIPSAKIEEFLEAIVDKDLAPTFMKIALEFLAKKDELEKQIEETEKQSPLSAHISTDIMANDHVVAKIGSVVDDPLGRFISQTKFFIESTQFYLDQALRKTIEAHKVEPEHFVAWANRHHLFDDVSFLLEGVRAWYNCDLVKALHVLVPQIETGLRGIVAQSGKPITKPHPVVANVSVAIGIGEILYEESLTAILGEDLRFHFLAIYADPRGINLRNRLAHGLMELSHISEHHVQILVHTLLIFGIWKEIAENRKK